MRDVNDDSNSSSWPLFYGDKPLTNGHYFNGFVPRTVSDAYGKDALKQKMLEHEAVFKNQVYELHRLYRRQRDMMEEVKRNEFHKRRISIDMSSSSSLIPPSQKPHEWHIPTFPSATAACPRPSVFGAEITNSPLSCSKANSSKDFEVLECSRPSKVRKKLFDLELPPDPEEEGERIQDNQVSEISSGPQKERNNGVRTFLDKDGSLTHRFGGSNGLADLNEPVHVEDANGPSAVEFLGRSAKPFLGQPHELFGKSRIGSRSGTSVENKGNGRDRLSYVHEIGNNRSHMNFTSRCSQSNQFHTPSSHSSIQHIGSKEHRNSHFNQNPSPFASNSYPFPNSPDVGNSRSPSWGKPNGSFTHKLTSFQPHPSFHEALQNKWHANGGYKPNTVSGNGFCRGSPSAAHLPSVGFDYRNCGKPDDRSRKIFKGSNFIDLTDTAKGVDLNTVQTLSNEHGGSEKTAFPWLKANDSLVSNENNPANGKKILGFPIFGNSCVSKNDDSSLVSTSASLRCVPGNGKVKTEIDINVAWDDAMVSEPTNKQIDVEATNPRKETDTEIEKIKNHFDLNSCMTEDEEVLVSETVENTKKTAIDINLEAPAVPETEEEQDQDVFKDKPEDEELEKLASEAIVEISGQRDDVGSASEVADCSDIDRLLWFAEAITFENVGSTCDTVDEYETLTLQLEETKEEDYMPKPLASDFHEPDQAGPSSLPSRPRRGQARRGRPRRDFQKDILPGLVSLSRHEVTEDLQIFGGLMRATGHSWNLGITRRNGSRGRQKVAAAPPRAATPPPPPLEVVGLEERSLTGWGKTTRRPRRQRCAAGNSVAAVQLT